MKKLLGVWDVAKMNNKQLDKWAEGIVAVVQELEKRKAEKSKKPADQPTENQQTEEAT